MITCFFKRTIDLITITRNQKNGWLLFTQQPVIDYSRLQLLITTTPFLLDSTNQENFLIHSTY